MVTYSLMGLFLLTFLSVIVSGCHLDTQKEEILSVNDTSVLRGIWSIIVVLVHIPAAHQNKIQDMIGSFAYIGVTFFFLASAYGLKYGVENKPDYLQHFWRKRLPKLLIPAFLVNLLSAFTEFFGNHNIISPFSLIHINGWVKVLLIYYTAFWFAYYVPDRLNLRRGAWQDTVVCIFVIGCSFCAYYVDTFNIWPTESWGFIYGILLANSAPKIKMWMHDGWFPKTVMLCLSSAVLGILYLKMKTVSFLGDYCLKVLLGVSITVFILLLTAKIRIGNMINQKLGSISYEIYLLHGVSFRMLDFLVLNQKIESGIYIWCAIILTIALSVLISYVSKKIEHDFRRLLHSN